MFTVNVYVAVYSATAMIIARGTTPVCEFDCLTKQQQMQSELSCMSRTITTPNELFRYLQQDSRLKWAAYILVHLLNAGLLMLQACLVCGVFAELEPRRLAPHCHE